MYHQLNKPAPGSPLDKLLALARHTIAFGLANDRASIALNKGDGAAVSKKLIDTLIDAGAAQHASPPFLAAVRKRFIDWFDVCGKRTAGEWLWDKPVTIAAPIVRLVVLPMGDKCGILRAFDKDVDLGTCFRNENSDFEYRSIPSASAEARDIVKDIMLAFYKDVLGAANGVRADVVGELLPLTRQSILQAHNKANKRLHVCPGCDGSAPPVSRDRIHTDLDHFFPQAKYPFLTVHSLNLTPYCKYCNQTFKGGIDPLEPSRAMGLGLNGIYHPYLRPAEGKVRVQVERDTADGELRLHLTAGSNDAEGKARLNSLNHVLRLEERWQSLVTQGEANQRITKLVSTLLRSALDDGQFAASQPDDEWFLRKIELMLFELREDIGTSPGAVAAYAYALWRTRNTREAIAWLRELFEDLQREQASVAPWRDENRRRLGIQL